MVESKDSVYDETNPPLVPAISANNDSPNSRTFLERLNLGGPSAGNANARSSRESAVPSSMESPGSQENRDPRMVASGAAGAVLGFLLGGPVVAALLGFGSAYATQKPGATGDAARALGDVAISAREKAEEIDRKHHVVDKSKKAAAEAWEQAKEYDRTHHVLDGAKDFAYFSWTTFVKFVRDHRLLERGVDGVGRGLEYVAEQVSSDENSNERTPQGQSRRN